jgi:tripartite-type tricarboxylate transporter receptor subunit TctC
MMRRVLPAIIALNALAAPAAGPDYPSKPIRVVVTFPPGGPTDVVARIIGQRFTDKWGHTVVIDNRAGGGGIVGTEIVARAAPDGYNLLIGTAGGMSINPALHAKLSYDPFKDFAPVSMLVINPQILVVHPAVQANTVLDLVALAKDKPGQLNFGSSGTGTATHLGLELFKIATGINVAHVPYKAARGVTDHCRPDPAFSSVFHRSCLTSKPENSRQLP